MPNQSLAVQAFSAQSLGCKAVLSETNILIPDGTPFEVVERMLDTLKAVRNCSLWWVGDILLFSERAFGEKYSQLLDASDFEYKTLRNVSYVVTHVAPNIRRPELTFWHHAEVAALHQDDQKKFLKIAVDQKLTKGALRALIQNKEKDTGPNKTETYELALRSILKLARQSKEFNKQAFDSRGIDNLVHETTIIAITAFDALRAFEK